MPGRPIACCASVNERRGGPSEGGDMKANTRRKQFKYIKRGTPVPAWLREHWKRIRPAPQADTIEDRALLLMRMHRDKQRWLKSRPKLLQALAWDLMVASLSEGRTWPEP